MRSVLIAFFMMFALFLLASEVFAQPCSSAGVKQFKPDDYDICATAEQICCGSTGQWSGWGKVCPVCDCKPGAEEIIGCSYDNGKKIKKCGSDCKWSFDEPCQCNPGFKWDESLGTCEVSCGKCEYQDGQYCRPSCNKSRSNSTREKCDTGDVSYYYPCEYNSYGGRCPNYLIGSSSFHPDTNNTGCGSGTRTCRVEGVADYSVYGQGPYVGIKSCVFYLVCDESWKEQDDYCFY